MKRDLNLVRAILLELEHSDTFDEAGWPKLDLPGWTEAEISYHARLMHDGGVIDAHNATTHDTPPGQEAWKATGLTSKGHDFLDAARDDKRWSTALHKIGGAAASVTFDMLKEVLVALARTQLGV